MAMRVCVLVLSLAGFNLSRSVAGTLPPCLQSTRIFNHKPSSLIRGISAPYVP